MENLSPSQAANLLGVSPSTVRLWSRQFASHLSPDASQEGKRRTYNADDLKVLTRAAGFLRRGKGVEEVNRLLAVAPDAGDAGPLTGLELATVADVQADLIDARDFIERLAKELKASRDTLDQVKTEAEAATLAAQEAQREAAEAKKNVADLEAGLQSEREAAQEARRRAELLEADRKTDLDRLKAIEDRLTSWESATWLDRLLRRPTKPKPPTL